MVKMCSRCKVSHPLPNAPTHLPDSVQFACRKSLGLTDKPVHPANTEALDANLTMSEAAKGVASSMRKRKA